VAPIYAASEDPIPQVSNQTIVDAVQKLEGSPKAIAVNSLEEARLKAGNALKEGGLLITLGAGNIHEVGTKIVTDLVTLEELERYAPAAELNASLYEPLRRHATFLVGGPAQYWIEPSTFTAFQAAVNFFKDRSIPVRVLGRGSNLLIRDGGIRGAVIHPTKGDFDEIQKVADTHLSAGAGVRLKKLASVAQTEGLGNFEWMEGIPGNVGGSLRMNAGAMGLEMFDQIIDLTVLTESGDIKTLSKEEIDAQCEVQYRSVRFLRNNYALKATFHGPKTPAEDIQTQWDISREKRRTTQPKAASAGCVFKNPGGKTLSDGSQVGLENNQPKIGAGQLIDELKLKGTSIGKAMVSLEHGNFITNQKGATATEILDLIDLIKSRAKDEHDITLETEVQILGDDTLSF